MRRAQPRRPTGYRADNPHYQALSPYFADGQADGQLDCDIVSQCPGGEPIGPNPDQEWSYMYMRGYWDTFQWAMPHQHTAACDPSLVGKE